MKTLIAFLLIWIGSETNYNVDLPHPDGPTIDVSSPLFNSKDTPLSAFTFFPPVVNVCFRFLTVKILDTIR